MVPPSAVLAFAEEMTLAQRDWQLHDYGGALHAFTVPEANAPEAGVAYHAKADQRSWASATAFLREVLTPED
jgi:dienelactone hydrolase